MTIPAIDIVLAIGVLGVILIAMGLLWARSEKARLARRKRRRRAADPMADVLEELPGATIKPGGAGDHPVWTSEAAQVPEPAGEGTQAEGLPVAPEVPAPKAE
jgi:hypothetical protein